ncbi:uncharacterized protein LOC135825343, partial [Sycon ciliatum]|uniref:uncharacterized protein LOC135825343 n=1 Tax=Sycon ciliatum TaxID=27933 RepID=UPI0031F624FF
MASTAAAPASGNAAASTAMSGFICPNCVVTLPSAEKLQSHWLEFHAEDTPGHQDFTHVPRQTDHVANSRGRDSVSPSSSAVPDGGERNGENGVNGSGQGTNSATSSNTRSTDSPVQDRGRQEAHQLSKSVLSRPRACKVCHQIIWSDTMTCQVCSFHCHLKCVDKDTSLCGRTSAGLVSPVRAATAAKDKAVVSKSAPDSRAPQPHEPRGLVSKVRHKVAQGRARYIDESFDLDLCYITERLIAMSFPSAGVEATYRNNLNDVARMLKLKHKENYMVFNVSERSYDVSKLNHQVLDFGWPDHLAPPLDRLCSICKSIDSWLASDLANVAVVHCKGGKGRTGVVVSAYMHYSNQHDLSAEAALDLFAMKRFYDDRCGGVTQPSQRRLVKYFEWLLKGQIQFTKSPLYLSAILIHGIPNFDGHGYCRPYVRVYQDLKVVYTSDILTVIPGSEADLKKRVVFELATPLVLHGDVMIRCFHKRTTGHEVIFRLQFHTCAAVRDQRMVLAKAELDDAHSDRRFPDSARVELIFQPPPVEIDDPTIATALGSKISSDAGAFQGSPLFPSKTSSKQEPSPVVSPLQKSSVRGRTRIPPKISEDSLITVEQDDDTVLVERVDDVQSSIQGSLGKVDDELADVEIGRVGSFGVTSGVQRPPKREIPVKVSENSALGTVNQGYESIALVGNQGARPAHSTQVTHQQSTMSASSAGGSDLISLEDTISNAERQLHFPPVDAVKSASCYLLEHVDQVPELPSRRKSPRGSHDGDLNVEQSASMRTFPHSMATSVDDETPAVPSRRPNPSKNAKAPLGRVPRHAALMQMGSDPTSAMSQIDRRMQPQDLEPSGVRPSSSDVTHNYADVGAILAAKKQAQRTSPSPSPTASTDTVDEDDVTPILPERPSRFELEETASNSQLAGGDCSRTPKAEGPYSSVSVPTSSPTASDRQANMSPRAAFRELPPLPRQKVAVSNHGS